MTPKPKAQGKTRAQPVRKGKTTPAKQLFDQEIAAAVAKKKRSRKNVGGKQKPSRAQPTKNVASNNLDDDDMVQDNADGSADRSQASSKAKVPTRKVNTRAAAASSPKHNNQAKVDKDVQQDDENEESDDENDNDDAYLEAQLAADEEEAGEAGESADNDEDEDKDDNNHEPTRLNHQKEAPSKKKPHLQAKSAIASRTSGEKDIPEGALVFKQHRSNRGRRSSSTSTRGNASVVRSEPSNPLGERNHQDASPGLLDLPSEQDSQHPDTDSAPDSDGAENSEQLPQRHLFQLQALPIGSSKKSFTTHAKTTFHMILLETSYLFYSPNETELWELARQAFSLVSDETPEGKAIEPSIQMLGILTRSTWSFRCWGLSIARPHVRAHYLQGNNNVRNLARSAMKNDSFHNAKFSAQWEGDEIVKVVPQGRYRSPVIEKIIGDIFKRWAVLKKKPLNVDDAQARFLRIPKETVAIVCCLIRHALLEFSKSDSGEHITFDSSGADQDFRRILEGIREYARSNRMGWEKVAFRLGDAAMGSWTGKDDKELQKVDESREATDEE